MSYRLLARTIDHYASRPAAALPEQAVIVPASRLGPKRRVIDPVASPTGSPARSLRLAPKLGFGAHGTY